MDKRRIDRYLKNAALALEDTGIAVKGKINSSYRGQISSFGASVAQGSILAAVAVYCGKTGAGVETERLMAAIYLLKHYESANIEELKKKSVKANESSLFEYVKHEYTSCSYKVKEEILEYAMALKMAMNLFVLEKAGEKR